MFVTDDKIPIPVARYHIHSDIEIRIPEDVAGGGGWVERGWNGREGEFVAYWNAMQIVANIQCQKSNMGETNVH